MTHAQLCPICNGKGKIEDDFQHTAQELKQCHGCFGKGWVEVSDPIITTYNTQYYQCTCGRDLTVVCPIHGYNTSGYVHTEIMY